MTLVKSCCCCFTLRRGSFVIATYTFIYFIIFSHLSGPSLIKETLYRLEDDPPDYFIKENHTIKSEDMDFFNDDYILQHDHPTLEESLSHPVLYILQVVDFVVEVLGIISSLTLFIGLYLDKATFLIPWLIIIPFHTIIDTLMLIFILIDQEDQTDPNPTDIFLRNVPLFLIDLGLNLINVYIILCVLSQYQEYRMGRGTKTYENYVKRQGNMKDETEDLRLVARFNNQSGSGSDGRISIENQCRWSSAGRSLQWEEVDQHKDKKFDPELSQHTGIETCQFDSIVTEPAQSNTNGRERRNRRSSRSHKRASLSSIPSKTIDSTSATGNGKNLLQPSNILMKNSSYSPATSSFGGSSCGTNVEISNLDTSGEF